MDCVKKWQRKPQKTYEINALDEVYLIADEYKIIRQVWDVSTDKCAIKHVWYDKAEVRKWKPEAKVVELCEGRIEAWSMVFSKPYDKLNALVFCDFLEEVGWGEFWQGRAIHLRNFILKS